MVWGASCGSGPKVRVCLVDCPKNIKECLAGENPDQCRCNGECSEDGKDFTLPMHEMNNYACLPLDSMERLLKYCKLKGKESLAAQGYLGTLKEKANALQREDGEKNEIQEKACQEKRQIIQEGEE